MIAIDKNQSLMEYGVVPYRDLDEVDYKYITKDSMMAPPWGVLKEFASKHTDLLDSLYVTTHQINTFVLYDGRFTLLEIPLLDERIIDSVIRRFADLSKSVGVRDGLTLVPKPFVPMVLENIINNDLLADPTPENRNALIVSCRKRMEYGFEEFDRKFINPNFRRGTIGLEHLSLELISKSVRPVDGIESMILYRGEASKSAPVNKASSWTLSIKTASFFANRFSSNGVVFRSEVPLEYILHVYKEDGEMEVLIDPKGISSTTIVGDSVVAFYSETNNTYKGG